MKKRPRGISEDAFDHMRQKMVRSQLMDRDIDDPIVLEAMRKVPRHKFVSYKRQMMAYDDQPLPIGHDQTISQPYIVASMTQLLRPSSRMKVLEVGGGCGYQAAVLAEIVRSVFSIEYVSELCERAQKTVKELGYKNIRFKTGDGTYGWRDKGPFDGIIVTAAAPKLPDTLVEQLKVGGIMVIPMATDKWGRQFLTCFTKTKEELKEETLYEVRFVPMVGDIEA